MPVPDPRRFGVAEVGKDGYVTRFIEKPQTMENNLVIAGCYYFKEGRDLVAAIEEQFNRKVTLKNEFFLADAMTIMIERGTKIRVHEINTWLDTGTIEATLDTNKVLLDKMGGNTGKQVDTYTSRHVQVIEPSFIDPSAEISNSTIGPHASIGADCKIENSTITESIVEAGSEIKDAALSRSMVGRQAQVRGRGDGHVVQLNVGDNSYVILS
jgi:glucose-1-phosphate thymidylyltransferase